jgi:hypothetical protein
VLAQAVAEPVCTVGGVQTGPGSEAETQWVPMEPGWLRTPPWGPPPEFGPGVYTEAQTEGPAMRAGVGVPPWWLQEPPPHWALPHPMAAGREPAWGPWYPPGPPPQGPSQMDDLEERVVRRIADLLGPRIPARGREDLREAPQGLHAGAPEVEELSLPEELPLASSTEESGDHHDRFYGHGEAPVRTADLGAPAAPDARSIAWDLGQFSSDLSALTKEMEVGVFVSMALVINAGHTTAPDAKKNLAVGGKLSIRPPVQAAFTG